MDITRRLLTRRTVAGAKDSAVSYPSVSAYLDASRRHRDALEVDPPPHNDCPFGTPTEPRASRRHLTLVVDATARCHCLAQLASDCLAMSGLAERTSRLTSPLQATRIREEADELRRLYVRLVGTDDDLVERAATLL